MEREVASFPLVLELPQGPTTSNPWPYFKIVGVRLGLIAPLMLWLLFGRNMSEPYAERWLFAAAGMLFLPFLVICVIRYPCVAQWREHQLHAQMLDELLELAALDARQVNLPLLACAQVGYRAFYGITWGQSQYGRLRAECCVRLICQIDDTYYRLTLPTKFVEVELRESDYQATVTFVGLTYDRSGQAQLYCPVLLRVPQSSDDDDTIKPCDKEAELPRKPLWWEWWQPQAAPVGV